MLHLKLCLIAMVALSRLSNVLGLCEEQPDWIDAYCRANEPGSNHVYFLGKVSKKDVPEYPRMQETIYTMQALEVFGGSIQANQQVTIHSDPTSGLGDKLQKGTTYLIEAHIEAEHRVYEIDICDDYTSFPEGYDDFTLDFLRNESTDDWCW